MNNTEPTPYAPRPRIALAGGKSGGHVFPALAVADELGRLGADVVFFGQEAGMEARLARRANVPFVAIEARPLVGGSPWRKVVALVSLAVNALRARSRLRLHGAQAVLGTGGFVSAPTVLGARLAGLPVFLLEPNAEPGAANRLLSRVARRAFVAYPETAEKLHCSSDTTGVPVRRAFFEVSARASSEGEPALLILGGSQGAQVLNERLPALLLGRISAGSVVHQCGAANVQGCVAAWNEALPKEKGTALAAEDDGSWSGRAGALEIRVVPFIDDMPGALEMADLVISRAGAITLAELCAAGRGSILVPLPIAGAHQLHNARLLEEHGAAIVVEQSAIEQVEEHLDAIQETPGRVIEMGQAARRLAKDGAAEKIAGSTLDCLRSETSPVSGVAA